jgi:hypothetical protein
MGIPDHGLTCRILLLCKGRRAARGEGDDQGGGAEDDSSGQTHGKPPCKVNSSLNTVLHLPITSVMKNSSSTDPPDSDGVEIRAMKLIRPLSTGTMDTAFLLPVRM